MHKLGHIISVVSWNHWVFRVLQQTPSSRRPDRGWSDPGLCPSGTLLPPLLSPLQPEPSGCFLCSLRVVVNGSSSVDTFYAQRAVAVAQGNAGKCPTAHLHWHTPGLPTVPPTFLHQLLVLLPLSLLCLLHPLLPGNCQLQQDESLQSLASETNMISGLSLDWVMCDGISAASPGQLSSPSLWQWRANQQSSSLVFSLAFDLPWQSEWPWL